VPERSVFRNFSNCKPALVSRVISASGSIRLENKEKSLQMNLRQLQEVRASSACRNDFSRISPPMNEHSIQCFTIGDAAWVETIRSHNQKSPTKMLEILPIEKLASRARSHRQKKTLFDQYPHETVWRHETTGHQLRPVLFTQTQPWHYLIADEPQLHSMSPYKLKYYSFLLAICRDNGVCTCPLISHDLVVVISRSPIVTPWVLYAGRVVREVATLEII